jgi:hypothetical protein
LRSIATKNGRSSAFWTERFRILSYDLVRLIILTQMELLKELIKLWKFVHNDGLSGCHWQNIIITQIGILLRTKHLLKYCTIIHHTTSELRLQMMLVLPTLTNSSMNAQLCLTCYGNNFFLCNIR